VRDYCINYQLFNEHNKTDFIYIPCNVWESRNVEFGNEFEFEFELRFELRFEL